MLSREISTYGHTKRVYRKPGSCGIFVEAEEHRKKKKYSFLWRSQASSTKHGSWVNQRKERKDQKEKMERRFFFFLKQPRLILLLCVFTLSLI